MTSSFGQLPLTGKVGVVSEKEDKFTSWSGVHGYYSRPETEYNPFKTDKMLNGTFDIDAMKYNQSLSTTMRETNKSTVEFKPRVDGDSRMLGRSISMESFVDSRSMKERMVEDGSANNFKASFEKILNNNSEQRGAGLPVKLVYAVVEDCLGEDIPRFITDKFVELSKKYSFAGRITWPQFSELIPQVVAAVEADCTQKRELPALMVLMNRPRIVDKKLGSLGETSTTYQDNYNRSKPIAFNEHRDFVYHEPEQDKRSALNAAAKVLCAGTVKGTYQVPGFRGHIPKNIRNARKREHSDGKEPRPLHNDLRLTQRGMGCVLGYTGHVPHETSGPRDDRTTSCDPRTTNGAAYGPVRAYL